ncbi:MAG: RNA polymerase sigma factor [Deltaproteobacteria bacterium]|nr:RNA polymerase sigma factor [Deltaproteobacteria bacterium]
MSDADTPGIEEVFIGHYPAMVRRARQVLRSDIDAEDAAQEVLLRILKAPHLLSGVERMGAWLYTLVHRRCVDIIRGGVRRRDKETRAGAEELFAGLDLEEMMEREAVCAAVAESLDALEPDLRFAFVENVLEGRTFREISRRSQIPMGTLMARKKKATDAIRRRLQRRGLLD